MIDKAKKLKKKVQDLINKSEYKSVKVLGVSCSRADLEMIIFIIDVFLVNGNINGFGVYGNSKEVIEKAGITF